MQPFGRNRRGPRIWGSAPFRGGGLGPIEHKVPWAEAYLHTEWHLEAFSRLVTIEMGRKLGKGASPPFWRGVRGPHLTQSCLTEAYLHTKWHLDLSSYLATTDMGQKLGVLRPALGRGSCVPT